MRILVAGATGAIGQRVVQRLVRAGHSPSAPHHGISHECH
jgi:uncharacterized protein YbjT (DUF2867 family)